MGGVSRVGMAVPLAAPDQVIPYDVPGSRKSSRPRPRALVCRYDGRSAVRLRLYGRRAMNEADSRHTGGPQLEAEELRPSPGSPSASSRKAFSRWWTSASALLDSRSVAGSKAHGHGSP